MSPPIQSKAEQHGLVLRELMDAGGLSRAELHRRTGLRANTVGEVVDAMVEAGWAREGGTLTPARKLPGEGRGRPAVRVEIEEQQRDVVGLALRPKRVEAVRLNLRGRVVGQIKSAAVRPSSDLADVGARLLKGLVSQRTLAAGVSSTGLVDEGAMKLLFSSSAPTSPGLSLGPVLTAVGGLPVALENGIHALGDRWRLAHPEAAGESVLLIELGDGEVGASYMAAGGPADAGCVRGANELGHTQVSAPVGCGKLGRATVEIPLCYCGQARCLERVFSSTMTGRLAGSRRRLSAVLKAWARGDADDDAGAWIVSRLAEAVGNAVNLLRPHRVVWVGAGALAAVVPLIEVQLNARAAEKLLPVLRERVRFDVWKRQGPSDPLDPAVTAGYLALAMLTGRRQPAAGGIELHPRLPRNHGRYRPRIDHA